MWNYKTKHSLSGLRRWGRSKVLPSSEACRPPLVNLLPDVQMLSSRSKLGSRLLPRWSKLLVAHLQRYRYHN